MRCSDCQHDETNPAARFCSHCGTPFAGPAPRTEVQGPVGAVLSGQFHGPVTVSPPQPPPDRHWRTQYLRQLFTLCNFLPLQALAPGLRASGQRLDLASLYTPLLTLTPEEHSEWTRGERALDGQTRRLSALDQLSRHRHLLLLGDPGFGKSTFVNFVALCLCGEGLDDKHINRRLLTEPVPIELKQNEKPKRQSWKPGRLLPVRILLRELVERLPAQASGADVLWQFIAAQLQAQSLEDGVKPLKAELLEKGGLILLDGLDEVPEANQRRAQLIGLIEAFATVFDKCRILVTARTYAYQAQDWRLGNFVVAVLAPFGLPQMEAFASGWYTQLAARQLLTAAPQDLAQSLMRQVRAQSRLRDLAQQPLLLTFMAGLHITSSLPERRQELYEKITELLLNEWERGKFATPNEAPGRAPSLMHLLNVSLADLRQVLEQLAFDAHATQPAEAAHRTADLTDKDLVLAFYELKRRTGEALDPDTLKKHLQERTGLLIEHGVGRYTFPHRTFQEYLAACHLAHLSTPKHLAELARHDPDRWREVMLLAGAKLAASQYLMWILVNKLCPSAVEAEPARDAVWGAHLAGQLLAESAHLDNLDLDDGQSLERVQHWLAEVVLPGVLPPHERALAGRHLARIGDPRPSVRTLDQMEFCYVPPGPCVMGDGQDEQAHTVTYGYWLSRYPITNAQYEAFMRAGGYAEQRYWPEAEALEAWRPGEILDWWEGRWRSGPTHYGEPFQFANHPVVGVSWYEAVAFSRWLNEETGQIIGLPTEAEWEKAARGGLEVPTQPVINRLVAGFGAPSALKLTANVDARRRYPWVGDFEANCANTAESQIGATSAVGAFPNGASPYGCLEMAGNVWEWCQSKYKGYPYEPNDGREVIDESNDNRVLRGGSWYNIQNLARAALRDYGHIPLDRDFGIGFRVVCRPPSR